MHFIIRNGAQIAIEQGLGQRSNALLSNIDSSAEAGQKEFFLKTISRSFKVSVNLFAFASFTLSKHSDILGGTVRVVATPRTLVAFSRWRTREWLTV